MAMIWVDGGDGSGYWMDDGSGSGGGGSYNGYTTGSNANAGATPTAPTTDNTQAPTYTGGDPAAGGSAPTYSSSAGSPTGGVADPSQIQSATTQGGQDLGALAQQLAQYRSMSGNGSMPADVPAPNSDMSVADQYKAYGAGQEGVRSTNQQQPAESSVLSKVLQGMGIASKDGSIDYSNPDTFNKILKSVYGVGNVLNTLMGPQNQKSAAQLQASLKGPYDTFTPASQTAADAFFNSPYKRHTQAPSAAATLVASPRYAVGGAVADNDAVHASPGALGHYVRGDTGGQDDLVKAHVSPGEYIFDADSVSSLGDGNNEAGAAILDKWREELRRQKRSAPADQIPPKAKAPAHYLAAVKGAK